MIILEKQKHIHILYIHNHNVGIILRFDYYQTKYQRKKKKF